MTDRQHCIELGVQVVDFDIARQQVDRNGSPRFIFTEEALNSMEDLRSQFKSGCQLSEVQSDITLGVAKTLPNYIASLKQLQPRR